MATPLGTATSSIAAEIAISELADCAFAQHSVRRLALALGFSEIASDEITLAVAELGANVIKHAGKGALAFRTIEREGRTGIEVDTTDEGPGIKDVEQSFADGYSTTGSLGYGMGTVNRLMDELDISSSSARGTRILCRKWVKPEKKEPEFSVWDVGVFSRSCGGAQENGDAFVVKQWQGRMLAGVIDGLGHGEFAQKAAIAAQQYVQAHFDQPLEKIFLGAGRACRGTRGAVMALVRLTSPTQMEWASVGNVEVRAWSESVKVPFAVKRAILGMEQVNVHAQSLEWKPGWLLVLHTDGLRTHWQWGDFPGIEKEPAQVVAKKLMRELASGRDDATVLALKGAVP